MIQLILWTILQQSEAVPGNKSVHAKVLVFLAKTFAATDLFPGTGLLVYGSQNQLYYACNGGNGRQDSPCWVQKAHKSCEECINRTSFCIWVKKTQILALRSVFVKVKTIPSPLYVPTLNQLLPGAGRIFKALWDQSGWWPKTSLLIHYWHNLYSHIRLDNSWKASILDWGCCCFHQLWMS